MIIFLDARGNIVTPPVPEPIGRGSNDANTIYIVAPLSSSANIYMTFTLPNGESLFGGLAENVRSSSYQADSLQASYLFTLPDSELSVWKYLVKSTVTRLSGVVQYTVVTVTSSMRATSPGTFTVSKGGRIKLPEDPTPSAWDDILAKVESVEQESNLNEKNINDASEKISAIRGSVPCVILHMEDTPLSVVLNEASTYLDGPPQAIVSGRALYNLDQDGATAKKSTMIPPFSRVVFDLEKRQGTAYLQNRTVLFDIVGSYEDNTIRVLSDASELSPTLEGNEDDKAPSVKAVNEGLKSAGTAVEKQIEELKKYNTNATVFLNNPPTVTRTSDKLTVSFSGESIIFFNSRSYVFRDIEVSTTVKAAHFNLLYNLVTGELSIEHFSVAVPDNCVTFGCVYDETIFLNSVGQNTVAFENEIDSVNSICQVVWYDNEPTITYVDDSAGNRTITLKLPTCSLQSRKFGTIIQERTVESVTNLIGSLYKILYNIAEDDVQIVFHQVANPKGYVIIGLWHVLFGVRMNSYWSGNRSINLTLAPLILGPRDMFVKIDTVKKTITFPDDTLILCNSDNRRNLYKYYYQLTDNAGNTTASWANSASTAQIVFFDTDTELLGTCTYGERPPENAIILATIRTTCGQVSINAPYKINGKTFNFTPSDIGVIDVGVYHVKGVNHRGYSIEAPENTLSAYKLSKKKGFNYVECDVSFTSDNVPVLLHDETIDRTSNGTGYINALTFDEVRMFDFGSWFSSDYTGEKIPKFDEFILLCRNLGLHPYIEIKSSVTYTQIETLVNIVKRAGMSDKVSWVSFNVTDLEYVKNVNSKARLGYVVDTVTETVISKATELKTEDNDVFITASYSTLTDDLVTLCINADLPLEVWTVDDEASITSLNCYISGVTSDNLIAGRTLMDANLN